MARITRATPHLSAEEIKTRLQRDPRLWSRQRWLIIYHALVDPREARDITKHTGTTGPVEGQINRLKFIKRSMYGRGSFELLRQRCLIAA